MPEGDTVWRAARRLRGALADQELVLTDFRVPQHATLDLSGHVVDEVLSRGKHLLIRVAGNSIHTHLKMEGVWHVHPIGSRWRRPEHTARVVLRTATHEAVGFSLGIVEVVPTDREHDVVGHLGPDLLGPDWDLDEATQRVLADPERPVFLALLDQRNLAGLGNEYVNELLFVSGLHPERTVADEPDIRRVIAVGHQMLDTNKDRAAHVHGQHPVRSGALGVPPRAQQMPPLRHRHPRGPTRRPAHHRTQHLLVPGLPTRHLVGSHP